MHFKHKFNWTQMGSDHLGLPLRLGIWLCLII